MVRVSKEKVLFWARQRDWLAVKHDSGMGVGAFAELLTFVSPSGNIVNFAFNSDAECVDTYEGRRAG